MNQNIFVPPFGIHMNPRHEIGHSFLKRIYRVSMLKFNIEPYRELLRTPATSFLCTLSEVYDYTTSIFQTHNALYFFKRAYELTF